MADYKVITRGEVNALVSGTFLDDLDKAVLYRELSANTAFIVSAVNQASGDNYTADQALLGVDIRIAADIQVTLTPRQSTIGASATSVIFDITTAGTASVGTPVYSVVTATYDGGAPTSAVINGTQLTMTFPANTAYTSKEITARVKLTIDGREFESSLATVTQSRVEVTPSLSISYSGGNVSPASGNTNAFTITANYVTVTGYTVTSPATVGTTGATSVSINYPANATNNTRTFTVTVRGRDVYGTEKTATCTFTQASDAYTFSLSPASSTAEFTDTSKTLTITKTNVNNVGVCAHTNTTSEMISGDNLILGFSINHETYERTISVTLSGTTAGGRSVSCSATITQSGASGLNLAIVYSGQPLPAASGTTNEFSISAGESVTVTGYSVDVAGASMENTGATQTTLRYPANPTNNPVTYTVTVYASTPTGDTSASTTVTQVADSYTFALAPTTNPISASATTAAFNLTATSISNIGYYAAQSSNVSGISGLTSNSVTATGITKNTSESQKQIKLVVSGKTSGGRTVYATGTTVQNADTYTLSLTPDTNPVAAETTLALFTITSSNISSLGYVASGSENVVSCTISGGKARATITENNGAARNITVRISGTTIGGRTVYASATTIQSATSGYSFDLIPVGGEMSYVAASATSHTYEIWSTNINDETIGVVRAGTTSDADFDYNTFIGTFNANSGSDREVTIQISAKTLSDETVYADATVIQLGAHSETDFISVTPDGTAIGAAVTSITFNISWNYAKVGTSITFTSVGITTTPSSISVASISGSSATTVSISANTGFSHRRPTLTASMTDVVDASHSDSGFYDQATSRSMFEFQNDFSVQWDVTSATITFTYAYLTNSNVSLAATGGAYFNSGLTQPSTSVSITPNASSRSGSFTIYFAKNDSPSQIEYVITATGNHGEAGESTSLNDSITVTHNTPDGASLVLTPCSTTYYWNTANVTFNVDWTNINPGTSSNPGITITVSNGATATPNKYYSGDNGDEDFVVSGFTPGNSYTVTVTGRPYVGDNIVRTYTITIPAKPAGGSIAVHSDSDWHLDGSAGNSYFNVSWTNMQAGSTISLSGSNGMSNISPSSISITSANASGGSRTVNFDYSALSTGYRDLTLTADGTDRNGDPVDGHDYYRQHGTGGTSGSSLSVSAVTSSPVSNTATTVTFKVTWANIWGTISLTPSIGSSSPTSITADGSGNQNVTVTMGANTGSSSRVIRLTANSAFNSLTDYAEITQNPGITNVTITLEDLIDITAYNNTTYSNQPYAQVFLATGTSDTSVIATWNSNFESDPVIGPGGHVDGTLSLDSYVGESGNRIVVPAGTQLYLIVETDIMLIPSPGSFSGSCSVKGVALNGSELPVPVSTDGSSVAWRGYVSLGQVNSDTTYTSGSFEVSYSATAPQPNIWWTKTSGGASGTAINSVSDVPAYVSGTYDGRNVEYTIYLNWNSDVYSVDMSTSLINGASASRNNKTVTITVPANSGSSRNIGSITVTGTSQDGVTYDEETLTITQVAGDSVSSLLIEGVTSYTAPVNIAASGGSATYNFSYSNVTDIGTTYLSGAVTGATASTSTLKLTVGFIANSTQYARSWGASITGHTVFGTVIEADILGTQDGAAVEEYFYWVPRAGLHTTAATSLALSSSGTTSMSYETNISNIDWMYIMSSAFTVDTSTPGVVNVQFTANTGDTRNYTITARKSLTTLGTWTITQDGGSGPTPTNCTIELEYIDIEVLASTQYSNLTGSTAPQNWPSSNILSGSTTNDGGVHHITKTGSVSITVPSNTTIYIFADGKGSVEPYYEKTSVNSAYARLNITSEPESTVTMSPSSPGNYYMRGSFVATKNTTISVSGNFTARGF